MSYTGWRHRQFMGRGFWWVVFGLLLAFGFLAGLAIEGAK